MNEQKGTVKILKHESEILKNNPLGDKFIRDLYVYLPPDYESETDKNFPTVYHLTGFTGRGKMFMNDSAFAPNFAERMDKLISEEKIKPMIVVMPDCFTHYGGSQYINSSATGDYEDYLIKEIVPFTDENFRTIKDKNSRAVMGKSSGGYGSLIMAMRHADTFGLACSTAGDAYFDYCYLPDIPKAFRAIKGEPKKLVEKFWNEESKKGKRRFCRAEYYRNECVLFTESRIGTRFRFAVRFKNRRIANRHLGKMARTRSGVSGRKICRKSEIFKTCYLLTREQKTNSLWISARKFCIKNLRKTIFRIFTKNSTADILIFRIATTVRSN